RARRGPGHRHRHPGRQPERHLQPVLHHQGARAGHGARPVGGALRGTPLPRRYPRGEPGGGRNDLHHRAAVSVPRRCRGARGVRLTTMPPRILLVEDELNMARTLAKNLERAGYEVEHAPHGEAALARLASVTFDVVLTDLKMPVMDGMDLLRAM